MAKPPVSEQVQVNFRMPLDLRDRIKNAAERNGRSMNSEIITALEEAFPPIDSVDDAHFVEVMQKVRDALYSVDLPEPQLDFMWDNVSLSLTMAKGGKASDRDQSHDEMRPIEVPDPDPNASPDELLRYVRAGVTFKEKTARADKANELLHHHPDRIAIMVRDPDDLGPYPLVAIAYL